MLVELVLTICMQTGSECATFRQQLSPAECVSKIRRSGEKYGYDPDSPPYIEYAECHKILESKNEEEKSNQKSDGS